MTRPARRSAFTIAEMLIALGLLLVVMMLVAQTAGWSAAERSQAATRLAALEAADNVLEAARATPWAELTPAWAAKQTLPADRILLPAGTALAVSVEPAEKLGEIKRVTVAVRFRAGGGVEQTARLVGLFGRRGDAKGNTP